MDQSDYICYNLFNPSNIKCLSTPDIVDRVFAAYATDLGRIDEFIDEIDRWKIRWQQNIDKPERLIAVLNVVVFIVCFVCLRSILWLIIVVFCVVFIVCTEVRSKKPFLITNYPV
jgi:hypothetical protein